MFYAGMQYNKSKSASQESLRGGNSAVGNRQGGVPGTGQRMGNGANNGSGDFTTGDIISKDDKSIIVKARDGGSKIIFFSDSTNIGKTDGVSSSDLSVGQQVTVIGESSPEGSITAQSIQIRPANQAQPGQ